MRNRHGNQSTSRAKSRSNETSMPVSSSQQSPAPIKKRSKPLLPSKDEQESRQDARKARQFNALARSKCEQELHHANAPTPKRSAQVLRGASPVQMRQTGVSYDDGDFVVMHDGEQIAIMGSAKEARELLRGLMQKGNE